MHNLNVSAIMDANAGVFLPCAQWHDTDGSLIQAHGGQIQRMPIPDAGGNLIDKYVWVGENKWSGHLGNSVAVYTSNNLYHWTYGGDALRAIPSRDPGSTRNTPTSPPIPLMPYTARITSACSRAPCAKRRLSFAPTTAATT